MSSLNKAQVLGYLGKDPEVRTLEGGAKVATFSMATTETWKDRNSKEKKTQTEWHNIVLWKGLAEIAEKYLKKGSQAFIEGKIRTRSWDDKEGNKRYVTEIVGRDLILLGSNQSSNRAPEHNEQNVDNQDNSDDLPF